MHRQGLSQNSKNASPKQQLRLGYFKSLLNLIYFAMVKGDKFYRFYKRFSHVLESGLFRKDLIITLSNTLKIHQELFCRFERFSSRNASLFRQAAQVLAKSLLISCIFFYFYRYLNYYQFICIFKLSERKSLVTFQTIEAIVTVLF